MTLALKALGTSNQWRLIYLDHKPGHGGAEAEIPNILCMVLAG